MGGGGGSGAALVDVLAASNCLVRAHGVRRSGPACDLQTERPLNHSLPTLPSQAIYWGTWLAGHRHQSVCFGHTAPTPDNAEPHVKVGLEPKEQGGRKAHTYTHTPTHTPPHTHPPHTHTHIPTPQEAWKVRELLLGCHAAVPSRTDASYSYMTGGVSRERRPRARRAARRRAAPRGRRPASCYKHSNTASSSPANARRRTLTQQRTAGCTPTRTSPRTSPRTTRCATTNGGAAV
jgi:hypothetical protein